MGQSLTIAMVMLPAFVTQKIGFITNKIMLMTASLVGVLKPWTVALGYK